jgi:formylglycine-generating enzyme required for sulfatase activity
MRKILCAAVLAALMLSHSTQAEPEAQVRIERIELESASKSASLSVQGKTGQTNIVLYADEMASNSWKVLTNVVPTQSPFMVTDFGASASAERYYRIRIDATGQPQAITNMVWIEAGTFTMGSPNTEVGHSFFEEPQTQVTISRGFWMGKYEVTQREYQLLMANNPSYFNEDLDRPVENVTWDEATNYCANLTALERTEGRLPAGYVYRLPTEAEWEYACRAGTTTEFSYGDDLNYVSLADYAWYFDEGYTLRIPSGHYFESFGRYFTTHPVGQKLPNPWGLYDIHGNVWELCLDWFEKKYPGGSVTDPLGPSSGSYRVSRGGCYWGFGENCRSAYRGDQPAGGRSILVGFRVVLAAVVAQEFRAEFEHRKTGGVADGSRIRELDGFGEPFTAAVETNTVLAIAPAVEVAWPATSGQQYQVQWATEFDTNLWYNLGVPIPGTNGFMRLYESTSETPHRFYRVLTFK